MRIYFQINSNFLMCQSVNLQYSSTAILEDCRYSKYAIVFSKYRALKFANN